MIWSTPSKRRFRFGTIAGSNDPSRSRETSISTGPDLGEHGLRPGPIAHVLADRGPAVLMSEVLGQLSVPRGLEHVLRALVQQPNRANQAHTLLLRLRQQPLREVLLIDDLSRHRIDHLG